jgi:hypothetical protein
VPILRNFAEITHPDYPGDRLVACSNPALAAERARKHSELLAATEVDLGEVCSAVEREHQALRGRDKIALRVGSVINRPKMAEHFELAITDDSFGFSLGPPYRPSSSPCSQKTAPTKPGTPPRSAGGFPVIGQVTSA